MNQNLISKICWFVNSSISLDIGLFMVSRWSLSKKLEFLFVKYWEIILLLLGEHKFKLGESYVPLFGKKVFYDSPYGIAGYQSMLARHQKMIFDNYIRDVKVIIDVGANVGFFSMMMRENFPKANIYAIEPVPQIFNCLQKNLTTKLDKVFNLAISNKNGQVTIAFNENESATSHIVFSSSSLVSWPSENILSVESYTLDTFCSQNNIIFIDVLKVDTESFEAHVLRGATNALSKTRYLHIEISIEDNKNYSFTELNSLLYSKEFNFQLISFRNFTDKGNGPIPVGDFLYENLMLK